VRGRQFVLGWLAKVDVQTLGLANVWSSRSGKFDQLLLRDFPNGFVDFLEVCWQVFHVLN
jgi:hypothetical protein